MFRSWITAHPAMTALAGYAVYNAAVSSMPATDATSSKFYIWFYGFAHLLGMSLDKVVINMRPKV